MQLRNRVLRVSIGGVFTDEGKWNSSYEESGPLCHCRRLPDQACRLMMLYKQKAVAGGGGGIRNFCNKCHPVKWLMDGRESNAFLNKCISYYHIV